MTQLAAMSVETARTVAQDPLTAPSKLEQLALHEDVEVRQAVASNPNTSLSILFQLAEEFPDEFFDNPVFPLLSLENPDFYQAMPEKTIQNLLVHESVPDSWLEWVLGQKNSRLFHFLVANPITSRAILEKALIIHGACISKEVEMHVNYSGEMTSQWQEFFKDKFKPWENQGYKAREEMLLLWELGIIPESQFIQLPNNVKLTLLKQINSPQLIETVLAKNKVTKPLRLACAGNIFTPTPELTKLAYDNDNEVRETAMRNPNIKREVVEEYYRQHLMSNHPNSQSHELSNLLESQWCLIRMNAAKHPNLSLDDLEKCLSHSDINVRASVVLNPNIPTETLEKLAKDESVRIRCSVAQNSKTSIELLEKLSHDSDERVRACVAFNSHISPELSDYIKDKISSYSLYKYSKPELFSQDKYDIAVNAKTPLNELITIYKQTRDTNRDIRYEAMRNICQQLSFNQNITVDFFNELLNQLFPHSADLNIYTVIACHNNANQEIFKRLVQISDRNLRCFIIQHPNTSIELLEKFLQCRQADIRLYALQAYQNRYANSETSSNFLIEWETARRPNTPPEKLAALINSKSVLVREAIAMHPRAAEAFIVTKGKKTASTVLEKLAKDTHQYVQIAVANNPKTSIETLETIIRVNKYNGKSCLVALKRLLKKAPDRAEKHLLHYHEQMHNGDLRSLILQHPAAPIDLLQKRLRLLSWMERYNITQNSKTSNSILETLAKDANRVVRASAKERLENMLAPSHINSL